MAKRTETVYLADIIDSIERIQQYADGVTQKEFSAKSFHLYYRYCERCYKTSTSNKVRRIGLGYR